MPKEAEYRRAASAIVDDFREGHISKAFSDLTFLLYKFHDDSFQVALEPLGLYRGYTDEELRERLDKDRAWATTVMLLDFAEFLPQYKRTVQKVREKGNIRLGKYKVGFAMLPDGFDPFDAIATAITLAKKGFFRHVTDDLYEGNYLQAGREILRTAIPPVTEELLGRAGRTGYAEFFGDNISGWIMADSSQMERETFLSQTVRPRYSYGGHERSATNRVSEMRRRMGKIKEAYGIA